MASPRQVKKQRKGREIRAKTTAKTAAERSQNARKAGLTAARVTKLGLDHPDLVSAAAALGRRYQLVPLLEANPALGAAWRRGRLLRDIRRLSASGASEPEAAHDLRLELEGFRNLLKTDMEAAALWNEAKLDTAIRLKEGYLAKALEGNARAMAQVENVLRAEIVQAQFNVHRVPEPLVCEIFAVTRQTLNNWHRERGMPRNAGETTYDLPAVVAWYEGFLKAKAGEVSPLEPDPLRSAKAEQMRIQLAQTKGELLDRGEMIATLVAQAKQTAAVLTRFAEEFPAAAAGKTEGQLVPLCDGYRQEICRQLAEVPEELKLDEPTAAALAAILGKQFT